MKKIIILEGISTSGKTTLKQKLADHFDKSGLRYMAIDEKTTLMPLLKNLERDAALELLQRVILGALKQDTDIIIFDRLYFTHIFKTKSTFEDFALIENLLKEQQALLVLLTLEKSLIKGRIFEAMKHRDSGWVDHVRSKGSDEKIVDYYAHQQEKLIELTKKSKIKSLIIDGSDQNFDKIAENILREIV